MANRYELGFWCHIILSNKVLFFLRNRDQWAGGSKPLGFPFLSPPFTVALTLASCGFSTRLSCDVSWDVWGQQWMLLEVPQAFCLLEAPSLSGCPVDVYQSLKPLSSLGALELPSHL